MARAVEGYVQVQVIEAKGVHQCCEVLRDMTVAQVLTHDSAVVDLAQSVVISMART